MALGVFLAAIVVVAEVVERCAMLVELTEMLMLARGPSLSSLSSLPSDNKWIEGGATSMAGALT